MKTKFNLLVPFRLSNLILLLMLVLSLQVKAGADSYFSPTNRDQFNVIKPADANAYNYVDFRIFSHTSTPYSDRMNSIKLYYQVDGGAWVEFMSYGMADFDHPKDGNFFSSKNFGNSSTAGIVTYQGHVNGSNTDLRYLNFRWEYPSNVGGKTVKFRCDWKWELDWWCCSKWSSGTDYSLTVDLPVYNPAQITNPLLKTIDGTADGKWFNFKWDSYNASLGSTTLELYNNNSYTTKIHNTSAATGTGAAGSVNLALGALNKVTTVYPRLVFTIGSGYGYKVYTKNMNPVNVAGFPNPVLGTCSFDACTKTTSLNWTYANPSQIDPNSKVYIYRKVNDGTNAIYTLLTPSGLGMNVVSYNDNDVALAWDKKYTYIIRTIPNILNATSVNFTKTDAHAYIPELLVKTDITTSRLTIDFSSFTAVGNIAVVSPAKAANAEISWKMTWCTNNPANITIRRINLINSLDVKDFVVSGNSLKYVDYTAVNAVPYRYQLQLDNNGRIDTSAWRDVKIVDRAKFVSLTTSKGVLNDRIRLSWEIDKPLLSDKFVIYRKIYDNGSKVFNYEMVAEKQSSNKIENWEDLSVSPGILYQYQIKSYYQPATGDAVEVYTADSVGLGFSQPIGTISGNIVFGSGTAVGGVNVSVENQDMEQKLYKSIVFNKQGTQFGGVAKLKAAKHGCIATGFTWQGWLKPANRTQVNAFIYELRNEYSIRLDGNAIKVFIHDNSTTAPVITTNIANISNDKFFHLSVSYNKTSQYLKTSLNGVATDSVKLTATYACKNTITAEAKLASPYLSTSKNYIGNIDEMRLWNRALTATEISANYDRYLAGTELDLIGYWQMDEGINSYIFDKSNISKSYNENHISLVGATTSDVVPTLDQLSIKTTTDINGNYIIQGVPYKGNGSTYQVVPALGTHEFEPAKQLIFIGGTSSEVQSKISFKDISSFKISGTIFYENTNYPVEGVEFLVDGITATRDNVVLVSDATGQYEIDVPIGEHKITLRKNGHVFADADPNATLKMDTKYNFNVNKSNINFKDLTKVTLAGRVVGGAVQAAKPVGFNRSIANIGQAKVTIQPKLKDVYQLNYTSADSLSLTSGNTVVKSTAKVKRGEDKIIITTDLSSGEFLVQVPPIPMTVIDVQTPDKNKTAFQLENKPAIDMIPMITRVDTIHAGKKMVEGVSVTKIDSCKYHQRLDLTYKAPVPVFTIKDLKYDWATFGDTLYYYVDPNNDKNNRTIPLVKKLNGLAVYTSGSPVFTQGNSYNFQVKAYEEYIHPVTGASDIVPLSGAQLIIENKISSTTAATDYVLDSTGVYNYTFTADLPNLVFPHTKGMTASVQYNGSSFPWKNGTDVGISGIVIGAVPVGGVDFITKGPDKVIAVLRDPPGSNSYATLEKGSTTTNTVSYKGIGSESSGHKFIANLGGDVTLVTGIGVATTVKTANKLDIGGGIEQSVSGADGTSRTESFSMSESISTSSSPDYVGANGDVYIANSSNIGFAKCKQLGFKPTETAIDFVENESYIFVPMSDSTSFRYTQNHIVTRLIPNLQSMRASILNTVADTSVYTRGTGSKYLTTLLPSDPDFGKKGTYNWVKPISITKVYIDSVLFYSNQINQWENVIRRNEMEKLRAQGKNPIGYLSSIAYDSKNYSFDAGTVLSKSITRTSSVEQTNEVAWDLQVVGVSSAGLTVNSFGFTLENEVSAGGGEEKSSAVATENTITYSYTLEDGDASNYYSVDVFTPKSHTVTPTADINGNNAITSYEVTNVEQEGGPIFVTRGGLSSCPYEKGDSTLYYTNAIGQSVALSTPAVQIEKPGIDVLVPRVSGVASGKQATFDVDLKNLSPADVACWYQLSVDPTTNPRGAIITIDGTPLVEPRLYLVDPKNAMRKTIRLTQGSSDDLEYENIRLIFASPCESDIMEYADISAYFVPSCSDLTMQIEDRIVNTETGSDLTVVLKDFDKNFKNFGGIRLQYKGVNDLNWKLAKEFVLNSTIMNPSAGAIQIGSNDVSITYKFAMKDEPDQVYQFRARTVCAGDVYNETPVITVVKDMKTPQSMGMPSPSNGILTPENEASVTFNEKIQAEKIASTDVQVYGVLNDYMQTDNVGLQFDGNQQAFTEMPMNLQSSFTIEGKIQIDPSNETGTIFSIGEGSNKIALQAVGANFKVTVGSDFAKQTTDLIADASFQYLALSYNNYSNTLALMLWSNANKTKSLLFSEQLPNGIAPTGRIMVGNGFKGLLRQLSVWSEARSYATITADRSKSKTGNELNLAGYWLMDEGYGKIAVDKARGRNLTVGSSWYISPKGLATELNGENQVVVKSGHIPFTKDNDFSLEFWFRGQAGQKNATLYSCVGDETAGSKNLMIAFNEDGNLTLSTHDNLYVLNSGVVLDNVWHHFALSVLRSGNTNIYIDGTQKFQTSSTNIGGMASDSVAFGARRWYEADATKPTIDNRFVGSMDEIRIWNSALTGDNVRLDMRSKLAGNETGLVAYYPFEQVNSSNDIVSSVNDFSIPAYSFMDNGGFAMAKDVAFTDNTPAIKATRPRVKVNSTFTSSENKIIVNINEDANRIENCVLEFEVQRIMDLNGNRLASPLKWTAFVNQNRLKWQTEAVNLKKEVLEPLSFDATLTNSSGNYENYVISGLPDWLSVTKTTGTLNPLEKTTLTFTVDKSANIGAYECELRLTGSKNIDEVLPVFLKVTGARPDWSVNPYEYESSMNITGQLLIEGIYQEDQEDMLAAFIDSRCVGLGRPVFNAQLNSFRVYLDVYGNSEDNGRPIVYSLWDAGTGRLYPGIEIESGTGAFVAGGMVGSVSQPARFNATDKIEQQLSIKKGWNWISTNVESTSPALLEQLKNQMGTDGILIKSRSDGFLGYSASSWDGSLLTVAQKSMYMIKSALSKTVKLEGSVAKAPDYPVSLNPDWNWIGYIPQFVAPVQEALSGLSPSEGDQLKGQIGFASYSGNSWIGSLEYLVPGQGYMYYSRSQTAKSFTYPTNYRSRSNVQRRTKEADQMHWSYNQNEFASSMTITAVVAVNNAEVTASQLELGAFIDNVCRGTIKLNYNANKKRYFAFLSVWGNVSDVNKRVEFRCFNNSVEATADSPILQFVPDNIVGSASNPVVIQFVTEQTAINPWIENFESGIKDAYSDGDVDLKTGKWHFNDALLGNDEEDKIVDSKGVRLQRTGSVTMGFDKAKGAGTVTIDHAAFGATSGSDWMLQLSVDGGVSWWNVGNPVSSGANIYSTQFRVNQPGNVRIRIQKTDGEMINIDNISITDYTASPDVSSWTGSNSSDWRLASNWSHGTPDLSTTVTVKTSINEPEVRSSVSVAGMVIEPQASLKIASGTSLNVSGDLTLYANENGTPMLVNDGELQVAGTTRVQLYLTQATGSGKTDNWWYLSSPVTGATSAGILVPGANNKFGYYREATASYPQITSTGEVLQPGKGYLAQINTTGIYTFTGTLNNGDIGPVSLSRTAGAGSARGFNLIGNPYPSHIDWNAITGFGTAKQRKDIRPTIWIRTRTASGAMGFDTFDGEDHVSVGVRGKATQFIAPMQAFWVKVNSDMSSPEITFTNELRSAKSQLNSYNRHRINSNSIRKLLRLDLSNGVNTDQTLITTSPSAVNGYDFYDSDKFSNNSSDIAEIFTVATNKELAINKLYSLSPDTAIVLGFRTERAGVFTLKVSEIENLETMKVLLRDQDLKTEIELTPGAEYEFTSDGISTSNRFSLLFRSPSYTTDFDSTTTGRIHVYVNPTNQVVVESKRLKQGDLVRIYNLSGLLVSQQVTEGQKLLVSQVFSSGAYLVKVHDEVIKIIVK